ncbi:MAG: metallophosphoesterase [Prevotellaceae bacterium]|jgi:3',5'-cyclic AMP phosphodiesterase CpdA|nr:metallophosphoesterase [Prevotellaceae bacterium]
MKPTANRLLPLLTATACCLLPTAYCYCQLPTATAMRFAVVTDTHLNRNNPQPEEDLRRTVDDINADTTIRFVLATGDLTESGDRESLQKAKNLLDQLHVKYYAIPGNHETKWSESGATDFGHIFGAERFDFEHGGIRFFGFNTGPIIRMMDGHISPADIDWLRRELAAVDSRQSAVDSRQSAAGSQQSAVGSGQSQLAVGSGQSASALPTENSLLPTENRQQPVILVTHYPLRDEDVDNWCDLTNVVRRYNIKAFIGGHYHSNRLYSYDGIPAFICRSNLRDSEDSTGGYSVFDVTADSIIVYERKPNGEWLANGEWRVENGELADASKDTLRSPFSTQKTLSTLHSPFSTRRMRRWGAYSMTEKYYRPFPVACTGYDLSVNTQYPQVREVWRMESGEWRMENDDKRTVATAHSPFSTLHSPFAIRSPFYASPAVYNNRVYVGDDNGVFSCYSLDDGSLQWQYAVGSGQWAVGSGQSAVGSGQYAVCSRSKQYAVCSRSRQCIVHSGVSTAYWPLPTADCQNSRHGGGQ